VFIIKRLAVNFIAFSYGQSGYSTLFFTMSSRICDEGKLKLAHVAGLQLFPSVMTVGSPQTSAMFYPFNKDIR